jgi:antitoxin VapB
MALNIRDPKAQRLARALADATGETMTRAVIRALEERLERMRLAQEQSRAERATRLMAHGRRFAALPVLDSRSPDEIIGYDEVGLPR